MDSCNPDNQHESDEDLLAGLLSDPEKGWGSFWNQYKPYIDRIVGRFYLGDHHPDVVQEIAQALIQNDYRKLRDWDPERSSLRRYLTVISVSCTLNYLKSSKHRLSTLRTDTLDTVSGSGESFGYLVDEVAISPVERLERIEVVELLRDLLKEWVEAEKIQPFDRDIIEYRLRGMTFKEISEVMGVSLSQVTTRFARIKPKLRKRLENSGVVG